MVDAAPCEWISVELTEGQGRLYDLWTERIHEIVQVSGQPIDLYRDGLPLLFRLAREMYPDIDRAEMETLLNRVFEVQRRALELHRAQPTGPLS